MREIKIEPMQINDKYRLSKKINVLCCEDDGEITLSLNSTKYVTCLAAANGKNMDDAKRNLCLKIAEEYEKLNSISEDNRGGPLNQIYSELSNILEKAA